MIYVNISPDYGLVPSGHTLRESIPRLLNEGSTAMTTCCVPACSQALPVKPQYWCVSEVTWPPQMELRRWRSSGPSSVMIHYLRKICNYQWQNVLGRLKTFTRNFIWHSRVCLQSLIPITPTSHHGILTDNTYCNKWLNMNLQFNTVSQPTPAWSVLRLVAIGIQGVTSGIQDVTSEDSPRTTSHPMLMATKQTITLSKCFQVRFITQWSKVTS